MNDSEQTRHLEMNENLDRALCRDFPNFFRDRHASKRETCMCYGFPGAGWEPIIREMAEAIEKLILEFPEEERQQYRAVQMKEKFGTLRAYIHGTEAMEKIADEAERRSRVICEECGKPGVLRAGRWVQTRCDEHAEGRAELKRSDDERMFFGR